MIPGDYRQRSGQCLSRPWHVQVSAVACSSLRHTVLAPFPRWDSLGTLCHRRCCETFEVFGTLRLSGSGGLLHGSWVSASGSDQPRVPQFAWSFSVGMRAWHVPCDCWFLADLPEFSRRPRCFSVGASRHTPACDRGRYNGGENQHTNGTAR